MRRLANGGSTLGVAAREFEMDQPRLVAGNLGGEGGFLPAAPLEIFCITLWVPSFGNASLAPSMTAEFQLAKDKKIAHQSGPKSRSR